MIVAVINLVIFIVGCVTLSALIVVGVVNLVDKGLDKLDTLTLRHSITHPASRLKTTNQIRDSRRYGKPKISPPDNVVYTQNVPYVIRILWIILHPRNNPSKVALAQAGVKNHLYPKDNPKTNEKSPRYLTSFPPIKHIRTIVNRLRRRVNQSGKEPNAVYNIGTGVETSDQEMFNLLAELTGYQSNPHYALVRKGEIYRICLDWSKAQKELGWQPRFRLREGLTETVHYYRSLFGK